MDEVSVWIITKEIEKVYFVLESFSSWNFTMDLDFLEVTPPIRNGYGRE